MSSKADSFIQTVDQYGAHNYLPLPVVLSRGLGSRVWDVDGKEYLDFLSCYSALNFGHAHPRLISALKTQAEKLAVCSRAFYSEELCLFSKELAQFVSLKSPELQVLPMNSGAEAVETAIKLVRKWGYKEKNVPADKAEIIAMGNNFHGRTVTIVSFSTEKLYRDGYGPFTTGFKLVPYGDVKALEEAFSSNTVGVLLEPIQAEAGILTPPKGFLDSVRKLCDRNKSLLIFDEIQTGLGRTGRNFCFEHDGVKPDVLVLGKSLGGGLLPISACIAAADVMSVIGPGEHGSTFGGNPLACSVAREALRILKDEKLSERAAQLGDKAFKRLTQEKLPGVKEVRGKGLLIGIELESSRGGARRYCEKLMREGVLCKETHDHTIRIAPPLTISDADLLKGIERIIEVIRNI